MGKQPARKTKSTGKKRRKKKSKGFRLGASFWIMLVVLIVLSIVIWQKPLEKMITGIKFFEKFKPALIFVARVLRPHKADV